MTTKIKNFLGLFLKKDLPDIRPGDTVKVYQKIPIRIVAPTRSKYSAPAEQSVAAKKEKGREKIQVFEGIVLARKHGKEIGATITVRKIISGIGVEKIFPLHSPTIEKIEIIKRGKVRRAKLYYLRKVKGKKARLKKKKIVKTAVEKESEEKNRE